MGQTIPLLPRLTTAGMVVIIFLRLSGLLAPGASLLDVIVLGLIGTGARIYLRSRGRASPKS